MNSISKYIFRQTAFVMIFVTVVLSFVIWLTQSLRFIDMVVNRGLPVTDFLWLAMLITPRFVTLILPFACAIATVYVYNRLITDRELIVLRAAGFSNFRLARPAIRLALCKRQHWFQSEKASRRQAGSHQTAIQSKTKWRD